MHLYLIERLLYHLTQGTRHLLAGVALDASVQRKAYYLATGFWLTAMRAWKRAERIKFWLLGALAIALSIRGAIGDDISQQAAEKPLTKSVAPMFLYDQDQEVAEDGTAASTTVQIQTSQNVTANGEYVPHHYI